MPASTYDGTLAISTARKIIKQVIGRGHQAHADNATEHQCVDIGSVLTVGNTGEAREHDEQDKEEQQKRAEEHGHAVVYQQTGENLDARDVGPRDVSHGQPEADQ